jgi:hypothetical protein
MEKLECILEGKCKEVYAGADDLGDSLLEGGVGEVLGLRER